MNKNYLLHSSRLLFFWYHQQKVGISHGNLEVSLAPLHYVLQASVCEFGTERKVEFFEKLTAHGTRIDVAGERRHAGIGELYATGETEFLQGRATAANLR